MDDKIRRYKTSIGFRLAKTNREFGKSTDIRNSFGVNG